MIVIIDYGMGNIGSLLNIIKKMGGRAVVSSDPKMIREAQKLILPGVGAFDAGMNRLQESGLRPILEEVVLGEKKPVLGICLGMQLLTLGSEEGKLPGLGWVPAVTKKFQFSEERMRVPHMGWNRVFPKSERDKTGLFEDLTDYSRFYFVHSFFVECQNPENILATTKYGHQFTSAIQHENILGVQFHPEKSHKFGMKFFKNFLNSDGRGALISER